MEGPITFWGYKEQESNLILPERDDDDADCHEMCNWESRTLPDKKKKSEFFGLWDTFRVPWLSTWEEKLIFKNR